MVSLKILRGRFGGGRHNFIRPHMALDGKTPSQVCGITAEGKNKWLTLIQHAHSLSTTFYATTPTPTHLRIPIHKPTSMRTTAPAAHASARLNEYFKTKVEIPRIRMGKTQEIETLINEEALLFAMYLRNEKQSWIPRLVSI
jgi:hypothetical protein